MQHYVKQDELFYWRFYSGAPDQDKKLWKRRPFIIPAPCIYDAVTGFFNILQRLHGKPKQLDTKYISIQSHYILRAADQMMKIQDHPIRDLQFQTIKRHFHEKWHWHEQWVINKNFELPLLDQLTQSKNN